MPNYASGGGGGLAELVDFTRSVIQPTILHQKL